MKRINLLLLAFAIFGMLSCTTYSDPGPEVDIYANSFFVVDQDGNDLLNPNNANHIDIDEIKIYNIINGEKTLYYKPLMNVKNGCRLWGRPERQVLVIEGVQRDNIHKTVTTHIEWSPGDVDILESSCYSSDFTVNGSDTGIEKLSDEFPGNIATKVIQR